MSAPGSAANRERKRSLSASVGLAISLRCPSFGLTYNSKRLGHALPGASQENANDTSAY